MKKILAAALLVIAYVWIVSTGREEFVLDQGKRLYNLVAEWFKDTSVNFQIYEHSPASIKKKHSKRWD